MILAPGVVVAVPPPRGLLLLHFVVLRMLHTHPPCPYRRTDWQSEVVRNVLTLEREKINTPTVLNTHCDSLCVRHEPLGHQPPGHGLGGGSPLVVVAAVMVVVVLRPLPVPLPLLLPLRLPPPPALTPVPPLVLVGPLVAGFAVPLVRPRALRPAVDRSVKEVGWAETPRDRISPSD